ncbi:MAG: hypothetical protein Q8S84_07365 [bacterium]|nr:hypothetical protein [bacterium]MDP3381269.1 hypothetical protein [bacterium]
MEQVGNFSVNPSAIMKKILKTKKITLEKKEPNEDVLKQNEHK